MSNRTENDRQNDSTIPAPRTCEDRTTTRPVWQTAPCPAWCSAWHRPDDMPDDRQHYGDDVVTALTLERAVEHIGPGGPEWLLDDLRASLTMHVEASGPSILLGHGERPAVRLTIAEAQRVAAMLTELVEEAARAS